MCRMNDLFIKGVLFEWNKISRDSYLRGIEALRDVNEIRFSKPVTLLVGENGTGNPRFLRRLQWLTDLIRRAGAGTTRFQPVIRIRNCAMPFGL